MVMRQFAFGLLATSMLAMPAYAQEGTASADQSVQSGDDAGLAEIIVTAQRREANLQDVPVAVTSISGDSAAALGIRSVTDIQVAAPAINWGSGIGGANVSVRGISGTGSTGDESANAIYVDGVYNAVGASLLFSLNNIERIEIDKGPQGTLFGRNASGGAVQIFTRDPEFSPSIDAAFTYGNYDTVEAQAYLTGGLSDTLAADFAVFYSDQRDGWGTAVQTGEEAYLGTNYSIRSKWKWVPDDLTSVVAIFSHNHVEPPILNGGAQVLPGENKPYVGFFNVNSNFAATQKSIQNLGSLNIRRDIGFATLASISAYEHVDQPLRIDADYSPAPGVTTLPDYETNSRTFTQELQLLSNDESAIDWVVGLYYLWSRNYRFQSLSGFAFSPAPGTPGVQQSEGNSPSTSYSAYGQATIPLGESTRLTGGLRYTIDERSISGFLARNGVTLASPAVVAKSNTDKKLTWRASIDHDLTENILAYASATRGFKSGFYNVSNPTNPAVRPQVVDAYEVGFKTEFFDRRVRFNTSAFWYDFSNIQVRLNGITGPIFDNAAKGRIRGFDIDFEARPIPALQIQGGLTYLDSEYLNFANGPTFAISPTGGIVALPNTDQAGNNLVRAPKWAASIGAQYTIELGDTGSLTLAGNYYYNDGFFFDPQNRVAQPSYNLLNASATWAINENFSLQFWAKNITDEEYFAQVDISAPTGDTFFPSPPRTYGATLRMHF